MAARSVAELLLHPFADLELDDVERMIAAVGEERESLFFERKAEVSSAALAKSCSAFANTMGGLLLVGIADQCDELIGIEQCSSEAQVWVKDILRGRVLPLPPFRARFIELSNERSLLLVLVEESSTTPHLLTQAGAIYVRNPGASDPVPISDQRRLLDLLTGGERARERAEERVRSLAAEAPLETTHALERLLPMTLAVAPIGVADWFERDLLEDKAGEERLRQAHGEHNDHNQDYRHTTFWEQHSVAVVRTRIDPFPPDYKEIETLKVSRHQDPRDTKPLHKIGRRRNLKTTKIPSAHMRTQPPAGQNPLPPGGCAPTLSRACRRRLPVGRCARARGALNGHERAAIPSTIAPNITSGKCCYRM